MERTRLHLLSLAMTSCCLPVAAQWYEASTGGTTGNGNCWIGTTSGFYDARLQVLGFDQPAVNLQSIAALRMPPLPTSQQALGLNVEMGGAGSTALVGSTITGISVMARPGTSGTTGIAATAVVDVAGAGGVVSGIRGTARFSGGTTGLNYVGLNGTCNFTAAGAVPQARAVEGAINGSAASISDAVVFDASIGAGPTYTTVTGFRAQLTSSIQASQTYGAKLDLDNHTTPVGSGLLYGLSSVIGSGCTGSLGVGVDGAVSSGTNRYGVRGRTPGTSGYTFQAAVHGSATANGTINGQNGIWTGNTSWAVYSNGPQFSTTHSLWGTSDARLKTDIAPLSGSLKRVLQLSPKTYIYNRAVHPGFNLPPGRQTGFVSQEVEKVMPELVMDTRVPDQLDVEGRIIDPGFELKAMNYNGLIPELVGAIQEQQAQIEAQYATITALEQTVRALSARLDGMAPQDKASRSSGSIEKGHLEQNVPNPFSENTVIRFTIPQGVRDAALRVLTRDGVEWKSFSSLPTGSNQVLISGGSMAAGTYVYELIVDGVSVDRKSMLITR